MKHESDLWRHLNTQFKPDPEITLQRIETLSRGTPDVLYSTGKFFQKNSDIEKRLLQPCSTGWIELKLVNLDKLAYNGKYDYGLRSEQALWLNTWWRRGGTCWILLGLITKNKWEKFHLISGRHSYRLLRKCSLQELQEISITETNIKNFKKVLTDDKIIDH